MKRKGENTMTKHTLYIGLHDQKTKHQEITTIDAYKIVSNIFAKTTGGATITEAIGVYTYNDGTIAIEPSLRCEIFGADLEPVYAAISQIKTALNQEKIALEETEVNSKFI
jgi:gamma-glutamylcysteine synthetase